MATIPAELDDNIRPETPPILRQSSSPQISIVEASEFATAVDQLDISTLASSLKLPEDSSSPFLSPIPVSVPLAKQKHLFSLSDLLNGNEGGGLESLGPEIATAEINIAADGSFIESSSGPAARELKRRYDQLAGVGPTLRSPYTLTAFVNQHGKPMYRLGFRDGNSAPAASAAEVEDRMCHASDSSHSPRTKRRSRLSMHFLPPAIFTKGNPSVHQLPGRASTTSTASKKLHRKIRSIPDLVSAAMGEQSEQSGTSGPTFAVTGRGHSQSVTAVDSARSSLVFQSLPPKIDSFGELLDLGPKNNSVRSITISTDPGRPRATVLQPFGPGVLFNVPSKKGAADRLRPPRQLREMQSFESSMTARQDDVSVEFDESQEHELNRPPSAIRLSQIPSLVEPQNDAEPALEPTSELDETISPESLQYSSQYSIEVFNVLQKYSGLPVFESLVPEADEGTTVIKLSLSMDTNVAPRDDPRFVIWGEIQPEHDFDDYSSASRDSLTDISPSHAASSLSRRSLKTQKLKSPEASLSASLSSIGHQEKPQRVLLAATIERWLAQLTSDLDYDELLVFFLTYRTCISAVDLCHLFICRFHWALLKATSREDETVRRFVRVRTFVAIRYWMLTFFTVDFIPNRDLRLLISDWLNTLLHDPVLQKHMDGFGIVRRLIKIAKDCKKAHTKSADKSSVPSSRPSTDSVPDHVLGKSFAKAIQKPNDVESDLDLDFLTDDIANDLPTGFHSDPSNAHLAHLTTGNGPGAGTVISQPRPTSFARFSLPFSHHADRTSVHNDDPELFNLGQAPPVRHNTLSRAFVRTIGRLGRWKRVFQPRLPAASVSPSVVKGSTVSAFESKINPSAELIRNRNVEDYLKVAKPLIGPPNTSTSFVDKHSSVAPPCLPPLSPLSPAITMDTSTYSSSVTLGTDSAEPSQELPPSPESPLVSHSALPSHPTLLHNASLPSPPPSPIQSIPEAVSPALPIKVLEPEYSDVPSSNITNRSSSHSQDEEDSESRRAQSFRSSSTSSFGVPLTSDGPLPPTFSDTRTPWQFDIVSIDDLDFSDTSSLPGGEEPLHPPGLRKQRKLPMRRDFEFVRHSQVSSMGIVSQHSMRDSVSSSAFSGTSPTSSTGTSPKPIQRWQMKSLQQTFENMNNNSNEKGDVEAALRRLEGQINPKVLQENSEKVNGWVRNLQERMAVGDYECSVYSEEIEDFVDEVDTIPAVEDQEAQAVKTEDGLSNSDLPAPHTSVPTRTMHQLPTPPSVDISPLNTQNSIELAVPADFLQSRMSTAPTLVTNPIPPSSKLASEPLQANISFIHGCASEQLAQHFTMIDRELFMNVKFEELVTGDWLDSEEIMDILDWTQYLKDRARCTHMSTALAALRARFNLTVAFVNAEIVLAPPSERLVVVSKFIWIAWHCYQLSNFHTLTAIMMALQSDWVSKAMRKLGWNRLGLVENRMFRDLRQFTSKQDDFKFMRQVMESVMKPKHPDSTSRTPSISGSDSLSGKSKSLSSDSTLSLPPICIPFIGIYLSQLRRLNKLPALIDPTAPNSLIGVDPVTANFDTPAHPEVFSALNPLPPSMHLEPLMNLHKQRRIAEVIKSFVAGQHLASRVHFDVDRKLFQKCLRLRGLDAAHLHQALNWYPD